MRVLRRPAPSDPERRAAGSRPGAAGGRRRWAGSWRRTGRPWERTIPRHPPGSPNRIAMRATTSRCPGQPMWRPAADARPAGRAAVERAETDAATIAWAGSWTSCVPSDSRETASEEGAGDSGETALGAARPGRIGRRSATAESGAAGSGAPRPARRWPPASRCTGAGASTGSSANRRTGAQRGASGIGGDGRRRGDRLRDAPARLDRQPDAGRPRSAALRRRRRAAGSSRRQRRQDRGRLGQRPGRGRRHGRRRHRWHGADRRQLGHDSRGRRRRGRGARRRGLRLA